MKRYYEGGNSGRGPSPGLWADCPVEDIVRDPNMGTYFFEDWLKPIEITDASGGAGGIFSFDAVTSGIVDNTDLAEGGIIFTSVAFAGADDGINAQMLTDNGGEYWIPATNQTLWFEARVQFVDWATTPDQAFIGLCDRETAIMAAGVLDTGGRSLIGFFSDSGTVAGRIEFASARAGVAQEVTDVTGAAAVANGTWVKLGFKVVTVNGALTVVPYVNGVAYAAITNTLVIPGVLMALSFVSQVEQVAAAAILTNDWVQIARLSL